MTNFQTKASPVNFGGYHGFGVSYELWYRTLTPTILRKWDNKCSRCGKEHERMHLHHKDYVNQNINTLVPLCPKCHKGAHKLIK